ncbi:hypothetical protein OB919_13385 [Halobacteria archaeon AArc-curdl1]|uniref:PGF-CTERM sorting domain-containing protein n=1 Tax=Natronosalvus hydrolyticus TaxID=2979988 RepID=A0AAP2Z9Q1_9EURY|nr:hypothetical protein [Halobacteria archaeon AArc-curdl1]
MTRFGGVALWVAVVIVALCGAGLFLGTAGATPTAPMDVWSDQESDATVATTGSNAALATTGSNAALTTTGSSVTVVTTDSNARLETDTSSSHPLARMVHDEATDPDDGDPAEDGTIETTYFTITYHEEYEGAAESIAAIADDHYVVLHQKFGLELPAERTRIIVGPRADQPCDAIGCVDPLNRVWLSTDQRSVLHHELVHTIQLREHWSPLSHLSPPAPGEGAFIEGTAKYLDASPAALERNARFDADAIELTPYPVSSTEYAERALFVEYVLANHGRSAFDAMYLEGNVDALEAETGESYATLRAEFDGQLESQRERLLEGGAVLPAFTHTPLEPEPGDEITLDARTPAVVEALDRTWYPADDPAAVTFAWDYTGDGEIDATGSTTTFELPDDGNWSPVVTLYATVDGETHTATQRIVLSGQGTLEVIDVSGPETAAAGESLTLTAVIENDDPRPVEDTVSLVIGETVIDSRTVSLEGGERVALELSGPVPETLEAGEYALRVQDGSDHASTLDAGLTVELEAASDRTDSGAGVDEGAGETDDGVDSNELETGDTDGSSVGDAVPGFGTATAMVALAVLVAALLGRVRPRS